MADNMDQEILKPDSIIDKAAVQGVRDALWRHVKLGESVVQWRDGRVVEIGPEELRRQLEATEPIDCAGGHDEDANNGPACNGEV